MATVTGNKKFWKSVKPLFLNKFKTNDSMKLIEDNTTITNELELVILFTLFRMGFFGDAHGWGEGQKGTPP